MKKKLIIVSILIAVSVASVSIFYGFYRSMQSIKAIQTSVNAQNVLLEEEKEREEKEEQEQLKKEEEERLKAEEEASKVVDNENVLIAGSYQIRDTSAISDAYKAKKPETLTSEEDKVTYQLASDILDKIIKPNMTPYEKEFAVFEWITTNVSFDTSVGTVVPGAAGVFDHPYGVLQSKHAVCAGFATTFRLFMHMLDIECKVIHSSDSSHSWNLVKLDGEWYHADCLKALGNGYPDYRNFNISDSMMAGGNTWDKTLFPAANGIKYSYAVVNAVDCNDIFTLPKEIKNMLDKETVNSFYKLKTDVQPDLVNTMMSQIQGLNDNYYNIQQSIIPYSEDYYILGIYNGTIYKDRPSAIPQETLDKMNNTINEAFNR